MITVFGDFDGGIILPSDCKEYKFDGGPNGGQVTYTICGGGTQSQILAPFQLSKALCVEDNSWLFSDFFMSAVFQQNCASSPPPTSNNAFIIERQSDGFSTYTAIPNPNTYNIFDEVLVDNDPECYTIMNVATVSDPSIYPPIISGCFGGGEGPPAGP